jgi:outer membrane protein assembly factor BamB
VTTQAAPERAEGPHGRAGGTGGTGGPGGTGGGTGGTSPGTSRGPAGRRRTGGRRTRRILLALAVLAAAGGGTALALHRGDSGPTASRHLALAWSLPAPAADDALVGSWFTGKLLIRASTEGGVTAYGVADGTPRWTAELPARAARSGTRPCAMSPTLTAGGLGTVAFGKDGNSCTTLAGIDTTTGTVLWTVPLVDSRHRVAMEAGTYVQGDVATIVGENFLGGLDIRTGRRVWGFAPRGYYCNAFTWGGPGVVLVDDYCADSKTPFTFTAYDGRTGRKLWSQAQDAHTDVAHVFTGSPLIISEHTAGDDSVRVVAPSGRSRKLAVGNTEVAPGNGSDADHSARIVGGVLITPAESAKGTEIDAFDVATGAKLWSRPAIALATAVRPGDPVHAVTGTAAAPQLVRLDPRTGHATALAALPPDTGHQHFTAGTLYVTPDGGVLELDAQGTSGGATFSR